jgi:hypothetical protein
MKFEITPEQSTVLKSCISKHHAASKTLQEAMQYHTIVMEENQLVSDEMWKIFENEFELDMSLDWAFTEIAEVPYIVSQKRESQE